MYTPSKVQQRLQLRIESQGKYLQSILEKACKALNDQAIATAGLDAAREELSDLAIKVANECPPSVTPTSSLTHVTTHIENEHAPNVDSCLSSQADAAKKRQRAMFMQSEWRGSATVGRNTRKSGYWFFGLLHSKYGPISVMVKPGPGLVLVIDSTSRPCPSVKSLSYKVGGMLRCCNSTNRYERLDSELERKLMEVKKRYVPGNSSIRSINNIILRFPQFRRGLEEIRGVFRQFDVDSNGTIDHDELRKCLHKFQFDCTEDEINDLFESCSLGRNKGMKFNEFIVVLCLIYLLTCTSSSNHTATMGSRELKATFDTIIEAFLFLDKNGDGKLDKKDMTKAMNDDSPREKSPTHITMTRFREMDWNKDGKVGFREFLFSLINWVGIDSNNEVHVTVI
ncbi:probable calcium-binding protein CML22 isoform X1 [Tanacetum coccineum]